MIHTHLSDHYASFYTDVISTTERQAPYVVDGLLYHETDLDIHEHYTDTHGYTDHVFAICHLLGFRFAPRIRRFSQNRLYTIQTMTAYPSLHPFIGGRIHLNLIEDNWDDILRLAASLRTGTVSASLILRKLGSYARQNRLAKALREVGRMERTLFSVDWIQITALRQRVNAGLLKGERRNSLARAVAVHRHGQFRDRSVDRLRYRASGLNLVTMAIALWNTVYLSHAVEDLRDSGAEITDAHLRHLSPLTWAHIGLTGDYIWSPDQPTHLDNPRPLKR
jgi:TnpA family transposase